MLLTKTNTALSYEVKKPSLGRFFKRWTHCLISEQDHNTHEDQKKVLTILAALPGHVPQPVPVPGYLKVQVMQNLRHIQIPEKSARDQDNLGDCLLQGTFQTFSHRVSGLDGGPPADHGQPGHLYRGVAQTCHGGSCGESLG